MQTQETISEPKPGRQAGIPGWQWQASHLMPTERGIMAFVPAGPVGLKEHEAVVKVLQDPDEPGVLGLACGEIVVPLESALLEHLVQVAERGDGKAVVSIVSLPKETWMAVPLAGFEVEMEELERLRKLVIMETQA